MLLLHNKLTTASHPPNLLIIINMKKTKEDILEQLLLLHTATIQQLADSLELSGIAVRHHLLDLEAEGSSHPRRNVMALEDRVLSTASLMKGIGTHPPTTANSP